MHDITNTLECAIRIAKNAGSIIREGWGHAGKIDYKGEVDLVTAYDRRAEQLIIESLRVEFPEHHIYSEEEGDSGPGDSPYTWFIDPLDGTTNFAHGFPFFAVSIGLVHGRENLVGVVYDPIRDELFTAGMGMGSRLNGVSIQVSNTPKLNEALLATGFAYDRRTAVDNNVDNVARFIRLCQGIRRAGAAALDLAYVACGRLDGFWEMGLHPWDVMAGTLLISEAGGFITDFNGELKEHASGQRIVASNGIVHNEMLQVLGH